MAKNVKKDDIFYITDDEIADTKSAVSSGASGIICPKRNKSIGGKCKVCDYIQTQIYSKKFDKEHKAMKWARDKKAKLSWFANVVLPENPDKAILLELGDKAGNQIISGIENKGWRDIVHPHAGVGRELLCTKSKESGDPWPTYTISPVLDKADWEIPEEVWKNVLNLRDILDILANEDLNEDNYMHVRSLKEGETLKFRLCPPREVNAGEKKCFIAPVFRHWGVSEDHITGEDSLDWRDSDSDPADGESKTKESEKLDMSFLEPANEKKEVEEKSKPKEKAEKPNCFGDSRFFEEDDADMCMKCAYFKSCAKEVSKKG